MDQKIRYRLIGVLAVLLLLGTLLENYSYVFASDVTGRVVAVERIVHTSTIIGDGTVHRPTEIFTFSVAMKDHEEGEVYTTVTDDPQWALVNNEICAEARFFPHPPWDLKNRGSFKGARLIKLFECPSSSATAALPAESKNQATEESL